MDNTFAAAPPVAPLGRLMRQAPVLRVVLAFAIGILAAEYLPSPGRGILIAAASVLAVLLAASVCIPRARARCYSLPLLWLTLIALGCTTGTLRATSPSHGLPPGGWNSPDNRPVDIVATLADSPRAARPFYKVPVRLEALRTPTAWQPANCRMMLYLTQDSASATLRHGDRLLLHIRPQLPNAQENPHQFNYRRYLLHHGIAWQAFAHPGHWTLLPPAPHRHQSLTGWSRQLQQNLVRRIRSCHLSASQQGIAEALLLGWRDDLDPSTVQQFRNAGILHLLCVSGLHVGIVAWLAGLCLFFLGRRRWHRIVKGTVQIAAIWFFVLLTGMAPSTLRAGVMFTLLRIGGMAQRQPNTLNNLCTSALLLLLVDPFMLFDVGFQFSYMAVAGIALLYNPLETLLPLSYEKFGHRYLRRVWQLVCLTTSAQLATAPFVLYHFHQFSPWFLIANLTIVPFAGVLLATAVGMVVLAGLPPIDGWATWLLRQELSATDAITRWVGTLPHATLNNIYCDLPMALLLAGSLVLLTLFIRFRTRWALPAAAGCCLLAVGHLTGVNLHAAHQREIVAYNAGRHLAIECFDGRESYLICDTAVASNPALISYQRDGMVLHRRIRHTTLLPFDTLYLSSRCTLAGGTLHFNGQHILIADNARLHRPDSTAAPHPDLIVVVPGTLADTTQLKHRYHCHTILYRYTYTPLPPPAQHLARQRKP